MNADGELLISCLYPDNAEPLECGVSPEGAPSPLLLAGRLGLQAWAVLA
jgi:hypothetical protein